MLGKFTALHGTQAASFLGAAQRRSNLNPAGGRLLRFARNDMHFWVNESVGLIVFKTAKI
jgi:hypothetical protein